MISDMLIFLNPFFWVTANLMLFYVTFILLVFVVSYKIFFNPKATTVGRYILRFMYSLLFIMGLVDLSILLNPNVETYMWFYSGTPDSWIPGVRFFAHFYVSYTVTSLTSVLIIRRWWPQLIKTKEDLALVEPKHEARKENDDHSSTASQAEDSQPMA